MIFGSCDDNNLPYVGPGVQTAVPYDGKLYTHSIYDEGGQNNVVVSMDDLSVSDGGGYTHGSGAGGGIAVAINDNYVFLAITQGNLGGFLTGPSYPPLGYTWSGILRKNRSDMSLAGGFFGATGFSGAFKIINQYPNAIPQTIAGLACDNDFLYVSDPSNDRIIVLETETLDFIDEMSTSGNGQIAMSIDGHLWAVIEDYVQKISTFTFLPLVTIFPDNATTRIGVLPNGNVWFNDTVTQQVLIYNQAGTTLLETYGEEGGCTANNGKIENKYLGHILGFTRDGNYSYVTWTFLAEVYGTMITKHDDINGGAIVDRYYSWQFLECPDFNEDATEIHGRFQKTTPEGHFFTYDENNDNSDYRREWFTTHTLRRKLDGRDYLFDSNQNGTKWTMREIVSGVGRTRPCGLYQANLSNPAYFWRPPDDGTLAPNPATFQYDSSGADHTNIYPDSEGTIWKTCLLAPYNSTTVYLQRIPLYGFDSNRNPIYRWADMTSERVSTVLETGDYVQRFYYDPARDLGFLVGFTAGRPSSWFPSAGTVFNCYENWRGLRGPRTLRWSLAPSYSGSNTAMSIYFDGDIFSIGYMSTSAMECYHIDTGHYLGTIRDSRNLTWIDSVYGHKIKRIDESDYKILCMREAGGSSFKFDLDASQQPSGGFEISLGNEYFIIIYGDEVYIRSNGFDTEQLTLSSARGTYIPTGSYRDIRLTTLGMIRIDSLGRVGYSQNYNGPYKKLFDNRAVFLTRG